MKWLKMLFGVKHDEMNSLGRFTRSKKQIFLGGCLDDDTRVEQTAAGMRDADPNAEVWICKNTDAIQQIVDSNKGSFCATLFYNFPDHPVGRAGAQHWVSLFMNDDIRNHVKSCDNPPKFKVVFCGGETSGESYLMSDWQQAGGRDVVDWARFLDSRFQQTDWRKTTKAESCSRTPSAKQQLDDKTISRLLMDDVENTRRLATDSSLSATERESGGLFLELAESIVACYELGDTEQLRKVDSAIDAMAVDARVNRKTIALLKHMISLTFSSPTHDTGHASFPSMQSHNLGLAPNSTVPTFGFYDCCMCKEGNSGQPITRRIFGTGDRFTECPRHGSASRE